MDGQTQAGQTQCPQHPGGAAGWRHPLPVLSSHQENHPGGKLAAAGQQGEHAGLGSRCLLPAGPRAVLGPHWPARSSPGLLQTPRIPRTVTPVRNTRDHLVAPGRAGETWGRGRRKLCPGPGDRAGGSGARVTGSHKSLASSESATLPGKPSPLLSWHLGKLPRRHKQLCASSWGTTGSSALAYRRVGSSRRALQAPAQTSRPSSQPPPCAATPGRGQPWPGAEPCSPPGPRPPSCPSVSGSAWSLAAF